MSQWRSQPNHQQTTVGIEMSSGLQRYTTTLLWVRRSSSLALHQVNQSNDQHGSRLAIIVFGSNRTAGRYRWSWPSGPSHSEAFWWRQTRKVGLSAMRHYYLSLWLLTRIFFLFKSSVMLVMFYCYLCHWSLRMECLAHPWKTTIGCCSCLDPLCWYDKCF